MNFIMHYLISIPQKYRMLSSINIPHLHIYLYRLSFILSFINSFIHSCFLSLFQIVDYLVYSGIILGTIDSVANYRDKVSTLMELILWERGNKELNIWLARW